MSKTYTSTEVCAMTGCTYRQLDWWCRKGHVPGQEEAVGSGHRRSFTGKQVRRVEALLRASATINVPIGVAADRLA